MSLILDALRKSERARHASLESRLSDATPAPVRPTVHVPWVWLIALLLVVNAVVLLMLSWPNSHQQAVTNQAGNAQVASTAPAGNNPAKETSQPSENSKAVQDASLSRRLASAAGIDNGHPHQNTGSATTTQQSQAAQPQAVVSSQAPSLPTASEQAGNNQTILPLSSMPPTFQNSLPALHLDVHAYNKNPAKRYVIINMHTYKQGDTLAEGPKVVDITSDTVILEYQGQRFSLSGQ